MVKIPKNIISFLFFQLVLLFLLAGCESAGEDVSLNPLLMTDEPLDYEHAEKVVRTLAQGYADTLGLDGQIQEVIFNKERLDVNSLYSNYHEAIVMFDAENIVIFTFTAPFINHYEEVEWTFDDRYLAFLDGNEVCFDDNDCRLVEGSNKKIECKTELEPVDEYSRAGGKPYPYTKVTEPILLELFPCSCGVGPYDSSLGTMDAFIDETTPPSQKELALSHCKLGKDLPCHTFISQFQQKACLTGRDFQQVNYHGESIIINSSVAVPITFCEKEFMIEEGENEIHIPSGCRESCTKILYKGYELGEANCKTYI